MRTTPSRSLTSSIDAAIKRARLLAWVGTLGAGILAVLPGISARLGGLPAAYAPDVAILAATLIVLIWYTYWTFRVVVEPRAAVERERRQVASALSTALLAELQRIDGALRDVHDGGNWRYDPLDHPLLDTAQGKLEVFQAPTISLLAELQGRLAAVSGSHRRFLMRGDEALSADRDVAADRDYTLVKLKCNLAIRAVDTLVVALEHEGGSMPTALHAIEGMPEDMPALVASRFPLPVVIPRTAKTSAPSAS